MARGRYRPQVMAVNLSALQFKTPLELETDIAEALAETGLPPNMLELEITESGPAECLA